MSPPVLDSTLRNRKRRFKDKLRKQRKKQKIPTPASSSSGQQSLPKISTITPPPNAAANQLWQQIYEKAIVAQLFKQVDHWKKAAHKMDIENRKLNERIKYLEEKLLCMESDDNDEDRYVEAAGKPSEEYLQFMETTIRHRLERDRNRSEDE